MTETIEFRDVWQSGDSRAKSDAIAFWKKNNALRANINPQARAEGLCIIAYDGDTPVAVATVTIGWVEALRQKMAFLRAFVAPEYRSQKIVIQLADAVHESMSAYALANPDLRLGGTAAIVAILPGTFRPHGTNMTMSGLTPKGEPIIIRWFDHFRL